MNYLLDTNIIITYSRENALARRIEKQYQLLDGQHNLYISVVSLGEIDSYVKKFGIGRKKQSTIQKTLELTYQIDIGYQEIISKYGDIEAFSQGKAKLPGHSFTARNMGKNDLWIAATASHYQLTLLTTDRDFDHLDQAFLELAYIHPE
ncbi:MAG: type II toxin-antitoxin system VapC family toxin [Bacteroidota bacterium]